MSKSRRTLRLNTVAVDLGCSSCRKPKLSFIFHPKPKLKTSNCRKTTHHTRSSSSSWDRNDAASSASPPFSGPVDSYSSFFSESETDTKSSLAFQGLGRTGCKSVAVEKDSDDPYLDFRQSMLQMILENEIYSKDDLCELLNCFLQLNSPSNHGIIVRAFSEIWNGVFPVRQGKGLDEWIDRVKCKWQRRTEIREVSEDDWEMADSGIGEVGNHKIKAH